MRYTPLLALPLLLSGARVSDQTQTRFNLPGSGIDSVRIAELFQRTAKGEFPGVDGIVIARHGVVVAESYFNGYGPDRRHDTRSATKSITSLLVGIAIDEGKLSLDTAVVPFFPEYRPAGGWDSARTELRLRHLLTMRTGLACNDLVDESPGNEERMYPKPDWSRFFFDIPDTPEHAGEKFSYCTAGVALAGELLARAIHRPVAEFADEKLWAPLGITGAHWARTPTGSAMTGGNLELTPREMARVGQLMLDRGLVKGKQVVSARWVEQSCSPQVDESDTRYRYGYLWWLRNPQTDDPALPSCHASGNGGQKIFLFPTADLVVVFTGSSYNKARYSHQQPVLLLNQYILPALTS